MTSITPSQATKSPRAAPEAARTRAPLLVVLGNDALLAVRPATAVQLTHAALRAGFDAAVPASWGDELVAAACVRQLAGAPASPSMFCACPFVAQRVLATGPELAPFLASFVPPPVALARYLRRFYEPGEVRLTFVGRCPGAQADVYDATITPREFLRLLADRDIVPGAQPDAFEAVVPPDRRRFHSLPGGLPALTALRSAGAPHTIVELAGGDFAADVAQHLLASAPLLLDGAARLGCACAGAGTDDAGDARGELIALEPPRAFAPVVDLPSGLELALPLPKASRDATDIIAIAARGSMRTAEVPAAAAEQAPVAGRPPLEQVVPRAADIVADVPQVTRRRSPSGGVPVVRPPAGFTPITRSNDGRVLPRAYVARRRSGSRPAIGDESADDAT